MGSLKTPHLVRCSCCCMSMMLDHRYTEGDPSRTQITPLSCSTRIPSENPKWWNSQSSTVQSSISTSSISKPILLIQISSGDLDCSLTRVWWKWNCRSLLDGIPRYTPGSRVDMELSRWRQLFEIVLMHLCFEISLQMLLDSCADDHILWKYTNTSLVEWVCGIVVQTQILPESWLFKKEPSELQSCKEVSRVDQHS